MTEHIKRGATKHTDRDVTYEYDGIDGMHINSIWCCTKCDSPLELRQRAGNENYVEIGCECGEMSLDLRISDILQFKMDDWDTKVAHELGRTEY